MEHQRAPLPLLFPVTQPPLPCLPLVPVRALVSKVSGREGQGRKEKGEAKQSVSSADGRGRQAGWLPAPSGHRVPVPEGDGRACFTSSMALSQVGPRDTSFWDDVRGQQRAGNTQAHGVPVAGQVRQEGPKPTALDSAVCEAKVGAGEAADGPPCCPQWRKPQALRLRSLFWSEGTPADAHAYDGSDTGCAQPRSHRRHLAAGRCGARRAVEVGRLSLRLMLEQGPRGTSRGWAGQAGPELDPRGQAGS